MTVDVELLGFLNVGLKHNKAIGSRHSGQLLPVLFIKLNINLLDRQKPTSQARELHTKPNDTPRAE